MKKNLEIQDFDDKKTKAGKRFTRFKTNDGWMSCFDSDEIAKLKEYEGKFASVETKEAGEFQNISKCYGAVESNPVADGTWGGGVPVVKPGEFKAAKSTAPASMYVSYAKDIFCAFVARIPAGEELAQSLIMEQSIKLVKAAKEAFE